VIFLIITPPPPSSTLFPYTTLFRSSLRTTTASDHLRGSNSAIGPGPSRRGYGQRQIRSHRPGWDGNNSPLQDDVYEFIVELRPRSEEHTSELQSLAYLVCRLLLEKK